MERKAEVVWQGKLTDGAGKISTASGALQAANYSFNTRFADKQGTNPEELIAAAHAACFSMALAHELEKRGFPPRTIRTTANVHLARLPDGWKISGVKLELEADVPEIEGPELDDAANTAKTNCPVSRVLNAPIELSFRRMETERKAG